MELLPQPIDRKLILFPNRAQMLSKYDINPNITYFTYLPDTVYKDTISVTDDRFDNVNFQYSENPNIEIIGNKLVIYPNKSNIIYYSYIFGGIGWKYHSKAYFNSDRRSLNLHIWAEINNNTDSIYEFNEIRIQYPETLLSLENPKLKAETLLSLEKKIPNTLPPLMEGNNIGVSENLLKYDVLGFFIGLGTSQINLGTIRNIIMGKMFVASTGNPVAKLIHYFKAPCVTPEHDMLIYDFDGSTLGMIHIVQSFQDDNILLLFGPTDLIGVEATVMPPTGGPLGNYLEFKLDIKNCLNEPVTFKFYHTLNLGIEIVENPCSEMLTQEGRDAIVTLDLRPREKFDFNCIVRINR